MKDLTRQDFSPIFRDLVRALQPPRNLDRETERVYWETLRSFSVEVLRQSAIVLRSQDRPLWPTSGEWYRVARRLRSDEAQQVPVDVCLQCGNAGLVRVAYRSDEPFDIAICTCAAGRFYRQTGDVVVRARLALGDAHRIAYLEDFDDEAAL